MFSIFVVWVSHSEPNRWMLLKAGLVTSREMIMKLQRMATNMILYK